MASSSLLETPQQGLDSLPRYTRDPETTSIRSSAPSYISEAPSYHSNHIPHPRLPRSVSSPQNSLPTSRYAPGYGRSGSTSNVQHHAYNISEWSSATNGPRARHYQAVANRRVNDPCTLSPSIVRIEPPQLAVQPSTILEDAESTQPGSDPDQYSSPLEDPALVGPEAAAHATARRLLLERSAEDEALMKEEQKGWDFMVTQMADWRERERSWEGFRKGVQEKRFLGGMGRMGFGRRCKR
ncbi:hypothetical protein MMC22_008227 [Lobaria immixta]|nr:hypothetical protein [Lobaria immixta]